MTKFAIHRVRYYNIDFPEKTLVERFIADPTKANQSAFDYVANHPMNSTISFQTTGPNRYWNIVDGSNKSEWHISVEQIAVE